MFRFRLFRELSALAVVGALTATGCFVVEDTSDDDDGGEAGASGEAGDDSGGSSGSSNGGTSNGGSSNGGSSNGGSAPTGGTSNGGTSSGGSDSGGTSSGGSDSGGTDSGGSGPSGGSGGTPPGGAVMKFCNLLATSEGDIVLDVEFAGVRASANSGECSPVVPDACLAVPTGAEPEANLYDGSTLLLEGSFPTVTVNAGDEWLVLALLDDQTNPESPQPGLSAATFVDLCEDCTCAATDPIPLLEGLAANQPQRVDFGGQRTFRMVGNSAEILRQHGVTPGRFLSVR